MVKKLILKIILVTKILLYKPLVTFIFSCAISKSGALINITSKEICK